jgi:hypothetical protein
MAPLKYTDAQYKKIHEELLAKAQAQNQDYARTSDLISSKFPTEADREAYIDWQIRHTESLEVSNHIDDKETYVKRLINADFRQIDDVFDILMYLQEPGYPIIRLGFHKGRLYRLRPNPEALEAPEHDTKDTRTLLPKHILGVNTNIKHRAEETLLGTKRNRREASLSEESTETTHTDDLNDPDNGFAFLQLGNLLYTDDWGSGMKDLEMKWRDSGYAVVATIESNGYIKDVYILYDFNPVDPCDNERYHINENAQWGLLPGDTVKRAGVRIAKSLPQLLKSTPEQDWLLDTVCTNEYELVRAVLHESELPVVLRQKVRKEKQKVRKW